MSKHTPGPWEADIWGGKWYVVDLNDIAVASCGDSNANANLIAAAPDLLEALESVSKELQLYRWMQNCVDKRAQGNFGIAVSVDDQAVQWQALNDELRTIQNARLAAIARAKGESQ